MDDEYIDYGPGILCVLDLRGVGNSQNCWLTISLNSRGGSRVDTTISFFNDKVRASYGIDTIDRLSAHSVNRMLTNGYILNEEGEFEFFETFTHRGR